MPLSLFCLRHLFFKICTKRIKKFYIADFVCFINNTILFIVVLVLLIWYIEIGTSNNLLYAKLELVHTFLLVLYFSCYHPLLESLREVTLFFDPHKFLLPVLFKWFFFITAILYHESFVIFELLNLAIETDHCLSLSSSYIVRFLNSFIKLYQFC